MADVHVFPNRSALADAAAEAIADLLADAIRQRGVASLVLAGGSTPEPVYRRLAKDYADSLDWSKVHVFWGDERCVPPNHADSNERMAREAFLDALPIPDAQIHPMRCTGDPAASARSYADVLRAYFDGKAIGFDVLLLGLGADGHTASLFPDSPTLDTPNGWVAATEAPPSSPILHRLTLTFPALNASRHVLFLVSGADKQEALGRVLTPAEADPLPAARVRPMGTLAWYVDQAARGDG